MQHLKIKLILAALVLTMPACSQGVDTIGAADEKHEEMQSTSEPIGEPPPPLFGQPPIDGYPDPGSDNWRIGVPYGGVQLIDLTTGESLDASSIELEFYSNRSLGAVAGGCTADGGEFVFLGGQIQDVGGRVTGPMCSPTDKVANSAVRAIVFGEPHVGVREEHLLLYTSQFALEMMATGPGVELLIESTESFRASESTVQGLTPDRIQLTSAVHFSATVTTPTCEVHGGLHFSTGTTVIHAPSPLLGPDTCAKADETDRLAQEFFEERTTAIRIGDTIEASNSWGSITFVLSSKPPLVASTAITSFDGQPPLPDFGGPPQKGRISTPSFANRAGEPEAGFDVGLPTGWVIDNSGFFSISNDYGASLTVETQDGPWEIISELDGEGLMSLPDTIEAPLVAEVDGIVSETGESISFQQFRFGSNAERTWRRTVLWVLERNGQTLTIKLSYPLNRNFDGPVLGGTDRTSGLDGLTPNQLLTDIRFFAMP